MRDLILSELFGPTIQGEGPSTGRIAAFVRLGLCNLDCSWCVAPDTPVLMADWTEKKIVDVVVGDHVMSFRDRRFEVAVVQATMSRWAEERVTVSAGARTVVCTPSHVFANPHHKDGRRRSPARELNGRHVRIAPAIDAPAIERNEEWWRGWAQGLIAGDGHIGQSVASPYPKVWLAVTDKVLAEAYSDLVNGYGCLTNVRVGRRLTTGGRTVYRVAHVLRKVPWVADLPRGEMEVRGWLAGFFDAEGTSGRNQISVSQYEPKTLDRVESMLQGIGCPYTRSEHNITVNGAANCQFFFNETRPLLDRKTSKLRNDPRSLLRSFPATVGTAEPGEVLNLTTSSGFFFAAGMLVEQCDTPFTWDWTGKNGEPQDRSALYHASHTDVLAQVLAMDAPLLVVTGGEPMVQAKALRPLVFAAVHAGLRVEVETNGTLPAPADWPCAFNVSPKLRSSGVDARYVDAALGNYGDDQRATFKFVLSDVLDLEELDGYVARYSIDPSRVWVMPEGRTAEAMTSPRVARLADACIARRYNVSSRLHVLLWNDERGR